MGSAQLCALVGSLSIYLGTEQVRELVRDLAQNDALWSLISQASEVHRARLVVADKLDDQRRKD